MKSHCNPKTLRGTTPGDGGYLGLETGQEGIQSLRALPFTSPNADEFDDKLEKLKRKHGIK